MGCAEEVFEIHYYLEDYSHAMNAGVRNKCEAELLVIFQEVCSSLGFDVSVETTAYSEGGLRECWQFLSREAVPIGVILAILSSLISIATTVLSRIPISDVDKEAREKEIQELTIVEKKLAVEEKRLILKKLSKEIEEGKVQKETIAKTAKAIEKNHKIQTRKSNFFKSLNSYNKVTAVGFTTLNKNKSPLEEEVFIARSEFSKFVLINNELPAEVVEGAIIEIVAPVLREGNYKWKGIFKGKPISFWMSDPEYKDQVLNRLVSFQRGNSIECVLHINKKVTDIGELEISGYSVKNVLGFFNETGFVETPLGKKYRTGKKFEKSQLTLFDKGTDVDT
ncbi:hypothetical protein [uncultured Deefgea sp.]|uniref:hypothetical protein n=1 Tax=uncultured Deefgea sp. TaxID=1304914 RepID=UPI00262FE50E|nr:hypothetical protein [uncultured Deefgea sp.]